MVRALSVLQTAYMGWTWTTTLVTILVVRKVLMEQRMRGVKYRATDFVILNLCLADFCNSVLHFVGQLSSGLDLTTISVDACKAMAFLNGVFSGQSIFMVLLLGYLRYRIMTQSSQKRALTFQQVVLAVGASWGSAATYAAFFVAADIVAVAPSGAYCFHEINLDGWASAIASISTLVLGVMPASLLIVFYARAFHEVKSAEIVIDTGSKTKASSIVGLMGFSVIVIYMVSILPYSGYILYLLIVKPAMVSTTMDGIFAFFYTLNWGINPIIYFIFQKNYRRVLVNAFHKSRSVLTFTKGTRGAKSEEHSKPSSGGGSSQRDRDHDHPSTQSSSRSAGPQKPLATPTRSRDMRNSSCVSRDGFAYASSSHDRTLEDERPLPVSTRFSYSVEHQLTRGFSESLRVHHVRQQPLHVSLDERTLDLHALDERRVHSTYTPSTYTPRDQNTSSSYVVGIQVENLKKSRTA